MRAPDKPTIRRLRGRPRRKVDPVVAILRDLNDPTLRLAEIARTILEREEIQGRRIGYDIGYDEALDEAEIWFKHRWGDGIRRIKFESRDNAFGFIVRENRKPQPIQRPNRERAKESLRRQRT